MKTAFGFVVAFCLVVVLRFWILIPASDEPSKASLIEVARSVSAARANNGDELEPERDSSPLDLSPLDSSPLDVTTPAMTPDELHARNTEGFANAERFGRHRGGTHVLTEEGSVRFIVDPIAESSSDANSSNNSYGLWGSLGSRSPNAPHAEFEQLALASLLNERNPTWRLEFIQLVSLDRFSQPMAYDETELPTMSTLEKDGVVTRALDRFEFDAVAKLRQGQRLITERPSGHVRMVGGIYATEKCTSCHEVPEGTLLGAFTYRFSID